MQTTIRNPFFLLVITSLILSACAPDHYSAMPVSPVPPPSSFTHYAASPDVELFWNCSRSQPEVTKVKGAARNNGQREVRSILVTVQSLRLGDVPVLLTAEALPEIILYAAGPSPFEIDLPLESAPSRIDILTAYQVTAGPEGGLTLEDACAPAQYPNPISR